MVSIESIVKKGLKVDDVLLVPLEYDDIKPAIVDGNKSEEIYILKQGELYGFAKIEKSSRNAGHEVTILDCDLISITDFFAETAIVSKKMTTYLGKEKYAIIGSNLEILCNFTYDSIEMLSADYYRVSKDGRYGVIDYDGNIVAECLFDSISYDKESNSIILG